MFYKIIFHAYMSNIKEKQKLQLYSKKLAQNSIFCLTIFLTRKSNYEFFFPGIYAHQLYYTLTIHNFFSFLFDTIRSIMTPFTNLKDHHIAILFFWNRGIRSADAIHRKTNIPLRSIHYPHP
jgi:hypothetical protein